MGDRKSNMDFIEEFLPMHFRAIVTSNNIRSIAVKRAVRCAIEKNDAGTVTQQLYRALPYRTALMSGAIAALAQLALEKGEWSDSFQAGMKEFLAEWGYRFSTWRRR
jgi:hypothetical protein